MRQTTGTMQFHKKNMISSRREMGDCANSAGAGAEEKEIRLFYLGKKEECCW